MNAKNIIQDLIDIIEGFGIPDANCACHISPPCSDCVEYGEARRVLKEARQYLESLNDGRTEK